MKSRKFFRKTVHFLLLLALILSQSLPTFAADEEHRFEEAIRSVRSRDVSCFISHAWGPEDEFVDRLNKHLRDANIRTHYDRTDLPLGGDIMQFIQQHLTNPDHYVIAVYTPTYKRKAESEENSGVKIEWRYIFSRLLGNNKFIPILFGEESVSVPSIASYINYLRFTNDNYYSQFFDVLKHMLPSQTSELAGLRDSLRTPPPRHVAAASS
ncbi:MAG: toll/interleukin-1 receptor domain-containing protein [Alphaproteobacteria bacterium]|nr:toll/interleukin-1 receptor domain-containing protein [Alphaproteobacteria bacterium]